MKNFIFKSTGADLQKMFQYLETLTKNVLYLTYQTDKILKIIRQMETDKGLQKQVDDYYGPFKLDDETSPQTNRIQKEIDEELE